MAGEHTLAEILSQPQAWADALTRIASRSSELAAVQSGAFDEVLFIGCGSSYYLALAAAAQLRAATGIIARGVPASELWLDPAVTFHRHRNTLLVALSRSGATTETLKAVERFRAYGQGRVLTLTCYPDSALARLGDSNLVLPSGQERSIAQTRAFSVLCLACVALATLWSGRELSALHTLPVAGRRLLDRYAGT